MVISVAEFNLLVVGVDVLTDEFHTGLAAFGHKAERITGLELTELACGDELVVDGGHLVGKDDQRIFGNAVVGVTTEVEIRVVGHIDDRRLVGNCIVKDDEVVIVVKDIGYFGGHLSWESVVAIGADNLEGDA